MSPWSDQDTSLSDQQGEVVVQQLKMALEGAGWLVDPAVGMSHFRCDLGVRQEGDRIYRLGVMVDTESYYAQDDLIERDLMKPSLLQAFGWRIAQVLTCDWFRDREAVMARLEQLLHHGEDQEEGSESLPDLDEVLARSDQEDEPLPEAAESMGRPGIRSNMIESGKTQRYEYKRDQSNKFWAITWVDKEYSIQFGRVGTEGQTKVKTFADSRTAQLEAESVIRQKVLKGYERQ